MQVPIDGREISFHDLAIKCNMYEPNLRRILRYAILYHRVFCERRAGYVTHSAASLLLAKDPVMYDTLGMMYDESWQAFARVGFLSSRVEDSIVPLTIANENRHATQCRGMTAKSLTKR